MDFGYRLAVVSSFLFFGGIILALCIYGIRTWTNLDADRDLFKEKLLEYRGIIFPVLSLFVVILLVISILYLLDMWSILS